VLAIVLLCISYHCGEYPYINIAGLRYAKDYYAFLFFALIGIGMVMSVSKLFEECKFLNFMGRNSLIVLGLHILCIKSFEIMYCAIFGKEIHSMVDTTYSQIFICGIYTIVMTAMLSYMYILIKDKLNVYLRGQ